MMLKVGTYLLTVLIGLFSGLYLEAKFSKTDPKFSQVVYIKDYKGNKGGSIEPSFVVPGIGQVYSMQDSIGTRTIKRNIFNRVFRKKRLQESEQIRNELFEKKKNQP